MDELRVNVEPASNFDDGIAKLAEVIRGCAMMYAVATRRPAEEFVQSLVSRLSKCEQPPALPAPVIGR
jgi:hypothetical protein